MPNLIDRYILGARVAPVAVVTFTLFLAVSAWIPFSQWPIKLLGGSALLVIAAFVLAQLTRDAGKRIEPALWVSWGGPPSVRMLRHRDPQFDTGSKTMIHRRLVDLGAVDRMPTIEEEAQSPEKADAIYRTASDWLRRKALELKATAPFDVVHSESISYGFRRNLLGIKFYGLAVTAMALMITLVAFWWNRRPYIEVGSIIIIAAYLTIGTNAAAVKRAADEYAKRLLDSVQSLTPKPTTRARTAAKGTKRASGSIDRAGVP